MTIESGSGRDAKTKGRDVKELRDWIDVLFKVVLAVAGVAVGYYFSFQRQQNEDIKLIVDLATAPEGPKRLMGASIALAYLEQKRIPQALYVAVVSYANNIEDPRLRAAVNAGADAASREQPALRQALTRAGDALPVRIYFHIRQEADREAAANIEKIIESSATSEGSSVVVPGIQLISGTQTKSLLKCFRKAECEVLGKELVALFRSNQVPIELSDQSAAFERSTSIRPNHFEAWFAPGLKQ